MPLTRFRIYNKSKPSAQKQRVSYITTNTFKKQYSHRHNIFKQENHTSNYIQVNKKTVYSGERSSGDVQKRSTLCSGSCKGKPERRSMQSSLLVAHSTWTCRIYHSLIYGNEFHHTMKMKKVLFSNSTFHTKLFKNSILFLTDVRYSSCRICCSNLWRAALS